MNIKLKVKLNLLFCILIQLMNGIESNTNIDNVNSYICSAPELQRMVSTSKYEIQKPYSQLVYTATILVKMLKQRSKINQQKKNQIHNNILYTYEQLTNCTSIDGEPIQTYISDNERPVDIVKLNFHHHISNFSFNITEYEQELLFIQPSFDLFPSILEENTSIYAIYLIGLSNRCSNFYYYPITNMCNIMPNIPPYG
jgi:hypothetical protein